MKDDNEMKRDRLRIDRDLEVSDDGHSIIAHIETWFDVGKKFKADLSGDESWLNLYARFNPFADTFAMWYSVETDTFSSSNDYDPTDEEEALIKAMITEKIQEEYGQTPQEFCQEAMNDNSMEMGGQT